MFSAEAKTCVDRFMYNVRLLREVFYPRRCRVCGNITETGCFCAECRKSFLLKKVIRRYGSLDSVFLLYKYERQLKDALHLIKFEGDKELLPLLSEEIRAAMPARTEYFTADFDFAAGIPTAPERRRRRGFDVPEQLFSLIDTELWMTDVLVRVRNTMPLYELEPALRRQELQGCFKVCADVAGKRILLCDDIFTTGSTMQEAAAALKAAGARSVSALAFAASRDNWS